MLHLNPEKQYLLKEYVPGPDGLHAVAQDMVSDEIIHDLLMLSRVCRKAGINLDWFPANFIVLQANSPNPDVMQKYHEATRQQEVTSDIVAKKAVPEEAIPQSEDRILQKDKPVPRELRPSFGEAGAGPRITSHLAYIDYELNEYSDEWSFETWGIWYWVNSRGVSEFLKTGDSSLINDPPDSGKPIRTSEEQVRRWLARS
jgi:hypothetical protein